MVECWDFYLNPLNTVTTNEPNLGIALALESRSSKFQANHPFDLRLKVWVLCVNENVGNVQAPQ